MRKRNRIRPNPGRRPKRSRKPLIFLGGLFVGALVWFAPTIVVKSPLKNRILSSATSDFHGTVSVGSISAGWLSPITVRDVVALDRQGARIAEVKTVRVEKTLVSLIRDRSDVGKINIESPIIDLVLRADGSNIEDAIAEYMKPSDDSSDSVGCEIKITRGTVNIVDASSGETWSATELELGLALPKETATPIAVQLDTALTSADGKPGRLKGELQWQRGDASKADIGKGNLSLQAIALPIELATPAARRFAPGLAAAGSLDSDLRLDWGDATQSIEVRSFAVRELDLVAPQWIGQDRIQLASITVAGKVTHQADGWEADQLSIESDLGRLQTTGTAVVQHSGSATMLDEILEAVQYGQFRVDGQIDLARLARMMPQTLHVREGTRVSGGQLALGLVSASSNGVQRWDGQISASGLEALYEGRRIALDQPIVITVAAQEANREISIEKLTCESSFLQVNASGSTAAGAATLSGDFARLAAELNKFVDLNGMQFAGQMNANVDWQQTAENSLRVEGSGTVRQFELVVAQQQPWREQNLSVSFAGVGQPSQQSLRAIDEATLRLKSGSDELGLVVLPSPAGTVRADSWPVRVQLKGELRSWLARMQPVFTISDWNVDGAVDLTAAANISAERIEVSQADVAMERLRASNGSVFVNEPQVELKSAGTWDMATSTFTSPDTTLASSTIAFRATNVSVQTAKPSFAGVVTYRGNVGRLLAIVEDPNQRSTWHITGDTTGELKARYDKGLTTAELTSDVKQFTYLTQSATSGQTAANVSRPPGWKQVWQEPQLKLGATISFDPAADTLTLSQFSAVGETIGVAAQGGVKELAARCVADVKGQVTYDLHKLTTRLRSQLGDDIQISGRDSRPFSFRGPLLGSAARLPGTLHPVSVSKTPAASSALAEMIAQASLGWSSASVQGFAIGAGELDANLDNGVLHVDTKDLPVSEGTLRLKPTIRLDREPMVMTLPRGQVIDKVRISPEMCGSWLKYVTPLAAGATTAEGRFSASLVGATIPLHEPASGDIEGTLDIHQARLGPGPVAHQLLLLADIVKAAIEGRAWNGTSTIDKTWLDLPQQQVAFRMVDNRVYHDGFQVEIDDVVIRTRGSVGTDQTLSLLAEVPVRDEWLRRSKYLKSLRGQSIRVPLHGTLSKPQLDRRALDQIIRQAAVGVVQEEANNFLQKEANKLFGRGLEEFGLPIGQ